MIHLAQPCRLCATGPLGLRRCGGCGALWIVCDECDALWATAHLAGPPVLLDSQRLPCPDCGAGLWAAGSGWATRPQVRATGWLADALDRGEIELAGDAPPPDA